MIFTIGRRIVPIASARPFLVLPAAGIAVAALAILFAQTTGHSIDQVLFSGQEDDLARSSPTPTFSTGALLAVIGCKGLAYALSLGTFRGGPVFPALLLGTAVGLLVDGLPASRRRRRSPSASGRRWPPACGCR